MRQFRPWGDAKVHARVAASLRDFVKRQVERANTRKEFQEWYWKDVLPKRRIEKRPLDPKRDIYPALRSPEVHVEIRRVGR